MSRFEEIIIKGINGEKANVENGGLDVNVQDQITPPLDLYFTQAKGAPTALTNPVAINDRQIVVDSVTNISTVITATTGNYIGIFSGASAEGRFYFGEVLGVSGNTVTLDIPLDFAFSAGDPVIATTRELNVDGSVTPQIFNVTVGGPSGGITVDITRIILTMTHSTSGDDGKFGNIAGGVNNGIVLRRTDGVTRNIWDAKTNGDLANLAYDVEYVIRSGGGGDYGTRCRYTFAGQDKHGVAVRLSSGDSLEVIVQDDLTTLGSFRVLAAGHIVSDGTT